MSVVIREKQEISSRVYGTHMTASSSIATRALRMAQPLWQRRVDTMPPHSRTNCMRMRFDRLNGLAGKFLAGGAAHALCLNARFNPLIYFTGAPHARCSKPSDNGRQRQTLEH